MIVCVEAGENVAEDEDEVAAFEAMEADEGFEAEEKDDPPSPCQVLDGHFDALTALANEGRTNEKMRLFQGGVIFGCLNSSREGLSRFAMQWIVCYRSYVTTIYIYYINLGCLYSMQTIKTS